MSASSSNAGFLPPSASPLTRAQIEDALHDAVVGITGLAGSMVRPRWQPAPPKQPEASVNWCSIGITTRTRTGLPAMVHQDTDDGGQDVALSWVALEVQASFYGLDADDLADRLAQGLAVGQNRDGLRAAGLALQEVGQAVAVPELINNAWVMRVDLPLAFGFEARRTYPVRNLLCGPAVIESDTGLIVQTAPMTEEGI